MVCWLELLEMSAQISDFTVTLNGLGLQIAAAKKLSLELGQLLARNERPRPRPRSSEFAKESGTLQFALKPSLFVE
jgi:hypothetical protein